MEDRYHLPNTVLSITGILLVSLFVWQCYISYVSIATLSEQSEAMAVRSESLGAALTTDVWPPGYPLLLFTARTFHYPVTMVNLGLFYLTLGLIFVFSKRAFPGVSALWLPFLYSICAFNYFNLAQLTSEAMVVPLSLIALLLLSEYLRRNSLRTILFLGLCCSLLFISRYQSLLWLMPIITIHLVFKNLADRKRSLLHVTSFLVIALAPVSIVLMRTYLRTGYFTGMDRFDWNSRGLSGSIEYYASSTGFRDNIFLTLKTLFLDFLSPFQYATHEANQAPYSISALEIVGIILFLLITGIVIMTLFRCLQKHGSVRDAIRSACEVSLLLVLTAEFFFGYIFSTILIWTLGNNDPIYTRFLYPSYIYFIILMFFGYVTLRKKNSIHIFDFLFPGLFVYLISANLYKASQVLLSSK